MDKFFFAKMTSKTENKAKTRLLDYIVKKISRLMIIFWYIIIIIIIVSIGLMVKAWKI
jgi:hypothetical protein